MEHRLSPAVLGDRLGLGRGGWEGDPSARGVGAWRCMYLLQWGKAQQSGTAGAVDRAAQASSELVGRDGRHHVVKYTCE